MHAKINEWKDAIMPIREMVGADLPVTLKCDDYTLLLGDGCNKI